MEVDKTQWLGGLAPIQFEQVILETLRSDPQFNDVRSETTIGGLKVDIVAQTTGADERSRLVVFEVKTIRVANRDVIANQIGRRAILYRSHEDAEYILVINGRLSSSAWELAREMDLTVWDLDELTARVPSSALSNMGAVFFNASISVARSKSGDALCQALGAIAPGRGQASDYQKWVADTLEFLFVPPLGPAHYEDADRERRNRRDTILENWAADGFWAQLRGKYSADQIVVDAKNHSSGIAKRPVIDLAHYLKPYGCGLFGLIVSRNAPAPAAHHALIEQWIANNKMIIALSDDHMLEMIRLKSRGSPPEEILRRQIAVFRKSL